MLLKISGIDKSITAARTSIGIESSGRAADETPWRAPSRRRLDFRVSLVVRREYCLMSGGRGLMRGSTQPDRPGDYVNHKKRHGHCHEPAHLTWGRKLSSQLCLSRPAGDKHFLTSGILVQFVRDAFFGVRDQVFILAQDSTCLNASRAVQRR